MFSKILIANRGEIAVRIIRACKEMGIATVAVYSSADSEGLHASLADEAYCIGGPRVSESYLNMNAIITVAKKSGAEAIHPGYGLLSENATFAELCEENGIVFIGPSADIIRKMGDKDCARRTAAAAGVPVIGGTDAIADPAEALDEAKKIGFPVLIKACSGGGGKGIRLVEREDQFIGLFTNAALEAGAAFGDSSLYIEKYLSPVKHVEVQLLSDRFGNTVVLGDRDCSVQRKNQKLIEECPAATLPESVRGEMYKAAKSVAESVGYFTVGTIEFLLDRDNNFYFMEMNTRLQVEHSVTEIVCGVDIVKWQIRTAAGTPLAFADEDVTRKGHAIECRICAEDPVTFLPVCGKVNMLLVPGGPGVRFDTAVYQNYTVPPFYDSMIGKLIVCSGTREEAIRKMRSAISELVVDGIDTNAGLHLEILADNDFKSGEYNTGFLTERGYI